MDDDAALAGALSRGLENAPAVVEVQVSRERVSLDSRSGMAAVPELQALAPGTVPSASCGHPLSRPDSSRPQLHPAHRMTPSRARVKIGASAGNRERDMSTTTPELRRIRPLRDGLPGDELYGITDPVERRPPARARGGPPGGLLIKAHLEVAVEYLDKQLIAHRRVNAAFPRYHRELGFHE